MPKPLMDTYSPPNLDFERGEGVYLIEKSGEKYLDFISGIAVNALGHAHPKAVAALKAQADKLWHTSNMFRVPGQIELAEKYCRDSFADRVFFTNSGTEANLLALSTARAVTGREKLLGFKGSYHGSVISFGAYGNSMNVPFDWTYGRYNDVEATRQQIRELGSELAAVIFEPMTGSGGCIPAMAEFVAMIREETERAGALQRHALW